MKRGVCKNILYSNAMQLIKSNAIRIIDVREKDELKGNGINGSINIPISELSSKIRNIEPNRDKPILVYCSTGSRSIFACQILAGLGYSKVYNLQGGIG